MKPFPDDVKAFAVIIIVAVVVACLLNIYCKKEKIPKHVTESCQIKFEYMYWNQEQLPPCQSSQGTWVF